MHGPTRRPAPNFAGETVTFFVPSCTETLIGTGGRFSLRLSLSPQAASGTRTIQSALGIGETVLVFVVQPENQEGHAVVSIDRAR